MADEEGKVIHLFAGDPEPPAPAWAALLGDYLLEREIVEPMRHREAPNHPWPPTESPMLAFLLDRARGIVEQEGVEAGLVWLAAHAWFEGGVEQAYQGFIATLGPECIY